jgi:hypothetical protein
MQWLGSPGTQGTTCYERLVMKARNHLRAVKAQTRNDKAGHISAVRRNCPVSASEAHGVD